MFRSFPLFQSGNQSYSDTAGHIITQVFEITAPENNSIVFEARFNKQTITADCQKDYQVLANKTKKVSRVGLESRSLKDLLG